MVQLNHLPLHIEYCNCNWGTCIAPPTRRPRAHHRVNPYPGARRQNETEMFSDDDETSPSIAAVSAPPVACFMLAVQQQKRLCRQFVDVSAAQPGCHTMPNLNYWGRTAECSRSVLTTGTIQWYSFLITIVITESLPYQKLWSKLNSNIILSTTAYST